MYIISCSVFTGCSFHVCEQCTLSAVVYLLAVVFMFVSSVHHQMFSCSVFTGCSFHVCEQSTSSDVFM